MSVANDTPAALGYRLPAEWEPHRGTWLSWPHNLATWPDELPEVEQVMAQAVRALTPHEEVRITVLGEAHERHVRDVLDQAGVQGAVVFHRIPTNDAWIRDHGAIFVTRAREVAATVWGFNSWGEKYPPFDLDNAVPPQMAAALGVPAFDGGMILEGGSIESNGAGVLLTTEQCLLNPNRNPHLSREAIESRLREVFGVSEVVWLGEGIVGDDTDGHVDDVTRFVGPRTIVTAVEDDPADANYAPLQENLERLHALRTPDGAPYEIRRLPMPRPVHLKGDRMPASYANFYVGNGVVLMPAFDDPADAVAADVLRAAFPNREVVPLSCKRLIWGLGAFHCLTQPYW